MLGSREATRKHAQCCRDGNVRNKTIRDKVGVEAHCRKDGKVLSWMIWACGEKKTCSISKEGRLDGGQMG